MRGKLFKVAALLNSKGITPAHAGKTCIQSAICLRYRDHPRACGENAGRLQMTDSVLGSPPRMRGKHFGNGVFPWLILVLSLNPL